MYLLIFKWLDKYQYGQIHIYLLVVIIYRKAKTVRGSHDSIYLKILSIILQDTVILQIVLPFTRHGSR